MRVQNATAFQAHHEASARRMMRHSLCGQPAQACCALQRPLLTDTHNLRHKSKHKNVHMRGSRQYRQQANRGGVFTHKTSC